MKVEVWGSGASPPRFGPTRPNTRSDHTTGGWRGLEGRVTAGACMGSLGC